MFSAKKRLPAPNDPLSIDYITGRVYASKDQVFPILNRHIRPSKPTHHHGQEGLAKKGRRSPPKAA